MIVKKGDGWHVYDETGKKHLGGPYKTKNEAIDRLHQIEHFKKKGSRRCSVLSLFTSGEDGIERPAPGRAPSAFRIWKSGPNPTDHGPTDFSARSAELLMAEQATRGNLYSIDVDHMSLNTTSPPESRKAVGWHRLEVRDGELWAVEVQWTDDVRPGLEQSPPAWRYFSPAYDVDPSTSEVVSYLNTALTNNPATWSVTALASRDGVRKSNMKYEEIMSELAALARDESAGEDAAKAHKALKAMMPEKPGAKDESDKKDAEPPPPKDKGDEGKDEGGDGDGDEDDTRKASVAASRELAAIVKAQGEELAALRKEREDRERATLMSTKQVDPKVAQVLATKPLAVVREILEAMPDKPRRDPAAAEKVTATRGATQTGSFEDGAPLVSEEVARHIDSAMSRKAPRTQTKVGAASMTLGYMSKADARKRVAELEKAGDK